MGLLFLLLVILVRMIVWTSFYINYEFRRVYLHIRGGLLRSRTPYDAITRVESSHFTNADLMTGYRILSSKETSIKLQNWNVWRSENFANRKIKNQPF